MALIELDNIAHSYRADPEGPDDYALKRIHTTWQDGGAYALLGSSGCGKTTMLNIISGLLTPTQGKVLYDGRDVTRMPPERRNIAQVFQFPVLYDTMTVYENLAFPLKNRKVNPAHIKERVHEVAETLELTRDLNKRAAGLSADAKQKISLGRGLVREDVAAILFDEPLTVIDPHLKWQLRRSLKEIHKQFNFTFIYVTHDQVEAMTFADQIVIMYEGELIQTGTPEELFLEPQHRFVGYFIGSPGMNFMPCTLTGDTASVEGGNIKLNPGDAADVSGDGLEIGIRPMFIQLCEEKMQSCLPGKVTLVEDEGSSRIVSLRIGEDGQGSVIKARLQEGVPVPMDKCWIHFPPEHVKLFKDGRLVN